MGYRTDFEVLLQGIFEKINVRRIDHDPKAKYGNKPDFIVMKDDIPILYIEAKTIGESLDKIEKSKQMERYFGYANLVLTDYVEFRFYRNGIKYQEPIKIAEYDLDSRTLNPIPDNFEFLGKTLIDFTQSHKEPIKSGEHLAKIMGGKARRIRDNIKEVLAKKDERKPEILNVYNTIKKLLVHDLKEEEFADMYAQTLVYGLFVARYHDKTPENFSRQEARDLVPASNPFLRHFFDHIVGPDFDKRLEFIVNELCEVFAHADVQQLMKQYFQDDLWGSTNEGPDPVIHFYEDFLKEYDAELRKKMGAYYTPLPVVRFIVRSVDYLLQKEFNLPAGLADTSKLENGIHRVQILDPAVGTGTFLSAVIREIYLKFKENGQLGRWTTYVHNDLLPRLHGFELMMAPYTIAHLKLSMAFKQTGFKYFNRRLGIYLTNSLEESGPREDLFTGFGFAESIAEESKEAAIIKNETPIMVVIGNPPYSVSSSNKGKWITDLIKDYKKDLNERNIQPLSDDYIKFIRYAERFIEKNKTGIVAMITNNSFLDGIIHRQMRKHLLETFDEIYILDLHGSTKKKETAPDGSKDENVFDIQQGVAISIMIRKSDKKENLGTVKFAEVFGTRINKYNFLDENILTSVNWKNIDPSKPYYFFLRKNFQYKNEYEQGFKIEGLFRKYAAGVATAKDEFIIKFTQQELQELHQDLNNYSKQQLINKYKVPYKKINAVKKDIPNIISDCSSILYRPFDKRYTLYSPTSDGVFQRPRPEIMLNLTKSNLALLTCKKQTSFNFQHIFVSKVITDRCAVSLQTGEVGYVFPLFLYSNDGTKIPNLKKEIVEEIEKTVGKVTPEDILDYIYAVLHSPSYREKYKEFLKIDFPRVPYPKDKDIFKKLVALGTELRLLHLLELPKVDQFITTYPVDGNNEVEKVKFIPIQTSEVSKTSEVLITGNVWINKEQYFGNVPEIAWNFYIGGYQPAQKWLKDRKGRKLTNSDIEHYQKIIVALVETDRIMKEIDTIVNW
ncbi:type ISP restriction/modification enzyme [Ignavibacterium album]|uniref:type ISP restriction/modification enzyme n=1 Tax=Ignavibacterium album TaxID=591197 RepID=UPI0035B726A5